MSSTSWAYASVGIALGLTLAPASAREGLARPVVSASFVGIGSSAASAGFRAELALRWAPVHHQDVNTRGAHGLGGQADYITAYDFDGDESALNNWDNAGDARFPLAAHGYFSVVETSTHWFVVYLFFHPRDWSSTFLETEHENDAEGLLLTVARDGSRYGALRAAITVAHSDFYSYLPEGSGWASGDEDVDGTLRLTSYLGEQHPVTAQQAEGHGLKAWPYYSIRGDGVVYVPSLTVAETPSGPSATQVRYRLRDMLEPGGLWQSRMHPELFRRPGSFAGDKSRGCGSGAFLCIRDAANAPWGWNDTDDQSPRGAMASDPAALVNNYFRVSEPFSLGYVFNPFR
jgi:hypothetical protein